MSAGPVLGFELEWFDSTSGILKKMFLKFFLDDNTIEVKESLSEYIQKTKIPRNCRMLDRVSMAFGVELRFPFLEHDFLEYGLSLNPKSYFLLGKSKSILRETFKKIS
jgi:asparagine synthetase B (glutamine-hydrolysing)